MCDMSDPSIQTLILRFVQQYVVNDMRDARHRNLAAEQKSLRTDMLEQVPRPKCPDPSPSSNPPYQKHVSSLSCFENYLLECCISFLVLQSAKPHLEATSHLSYCSGRLGYLAGLVNDAHDFVPD